MIKDLTIAITLCPRDKETINHCISSIRSVGIKNKIYIFAEPGKYDIKDKNIVFTMNKKRLGCFMNYNNVLKKIGNNNKFLWICQDDMICRQGIKEEIEHIILNSGEFGYYNMYLSGSHIKTVGRDDRNERNYGRYTVGACFMFRKETIKTIIGHEFYKNHIKFYVPNIGNQQVDACIGKVCQELGLPTYYPRISWLAHIGEDSTVGHNDKGIYRFHGLN